MQVALQPPPLGIAGGHQTLARRLRIGLELLVLQRDRRRHRNRLDQRRILLERGVVDQRRAVERGDRAAGGGRQRDGVAVGVGVVVGTGRPVRQHEARVTSGAGETRLQLGPAQDAELPEQVGEPAAREPRAQQAAEEARRHEQE